MQKLNIKGIDFNFLIIFDTLFNELSVSITAEKLGLTQPNVSYALKKLRVFFNDELFVRTASGMQPTYRAVEISKPISNIVTIMRSDVLGQVNFDPVESSRKFIINTTDIGEITFIPKLIKHFRNISPNLSIESISLPTSQLSQAMMTGDIDVALGYYPELSHSTFKTQGFAGHPLVCIARKKHPLFVEGMTLNSYSKAEHIGLIGNGHSQKIIEDGIHRIGAKRFISFYSHNFMSIPIIVSQTDLIATVPKMLAVVFKEHAEIEIYSTPFQLDPIPIGIYWSQHKDNDLGHKWLRRTIFDIFYNNDPTKDIII